MKTPDDFNEWIKGRLEENPLEPPAEAWNTISESLDLEGAWEGINQDLELDGLWSNIDQRLLQAEQLIWWEKAGKSVSVLAAMVMLALPLWFQLAAPGDALEATYDSPGAYPTEHPAQERGTDRPAAPQQPSLTDGTTTQESAALQAPTAEAPPSQRPTAQHLGRDAAPTAATAQTPPSPASAERPSRSEAPTPHGRSLAVVDDSRSASESVGGTALPEASLSSSSANHAPYPLLPDLSRREAVWLLAEADLTEPQELPEAREETVVARRTTPSGNWRIGLGGSGRLSYLLNQKTFHAMDKSSLTTSLPGLRKNFSLQAEKPLSSRLALLADLVVHNEAGQRYEEYHSGIYGTTDTRLRYTQLNALLAYSPAKLSLATRPYTRWLAGLSGGWLHQAQLAGPLGVQDLTDEYRRHSAGLLLGVEYMIPLSSQLWMGYGVRSYVDLLNIYAGNAEVPAHFRRTRSSALDFTLTFKYEIRK